MSEAAVSLPLASASRRLYDWMLNVASRWTLVALFASAAIVAQFQVQSALIWHRYPGWIIVLLIAPFVVGLGVSVIFATGFHHAYTLWKPYPRGRSLARVILGGLLAWICLTYVFVLIGSFFFVVHILDTPEGMNRGDIPWHLWGVLGWQLGDSVPGIDLSGTLNYDGPSFDDKGVDGLRLAYKLFVLLPVLTVVYEVFRARPTDTDHPAGA